MKRSRGQLEGRCAILSHSSWANSFARSLRSIRTSAGRASVLGRSHSAGADADAFASDEIAAGASDISRDLWVTFLNRIERSMSKLKNELVVCRFKEDVTWTKRWSDSAIVTVYDKGGSESNSSWIPLKNEGRESDAFIRHIIDRYPDFPEVTVFAQGCPFDHVEMPCYYHVLDELLFAKDRRSMGGADYLGMSRFSGKVVDFECERHKGLPIRGFCQEAGIETDGNWDCNYCAHFAVAREAILRHPKRTYETLLHLLLDTESIDVLETHVRLRDARRLPVPKGVFVMERLWSILFSLGGAACGMEEN